jgi:hypothetical protein
VPNIRRQYVEPALRVGLGKLEWKWLMMSFCHRVSAINFMNSILSKAKVFSLSVTSIKVYKCRQGLEPTLRVQSHNLGCMWL